MEENKKALAIKCRHCSVLFQVAIPPKSGTYRYVCPSCKNGIDIRFNLPPKAQEGDTVQQTETGNGLASENKMTDAPLQERKPTKKLPNDGLNGSGCLEIVRFGGMLGGIANTRFPLHMGLNTVGRADSDTPSDINIKNDPTISRRSVIIEVIPKENGFLFKMKVLRAANPVLHNDKPLMEGEIIYLNYGDSIRLGRTTLRFNKLKK